MALTDMETQFARDVCELGWRVAYGLRDENTDFGDVTREYRIARRPRLARFRETYES